jgi:hypothetical protein
MMSVGVNMADLTNDLKDRKHLDARTSDLAGAGNGSMDIVDVMKRMSITEGNHSAGFDKELARQLINESSNHPAGNRTMKDSENNGVGEINELLVRMGRKPNAEEMLKKDPKGLMRMIMGEENGRDGKIRLPFDEGDDETREKKQKKKQGKECKAKGKEGRGKWICGRLCWSIVRYLNPLGLTSQIWFSTIHR